MEVILLQRIERLGQIGDVVNVKPGFARNFLLPQKKALRATSANREVFEQQRTDIEAANLNARGEAEKVAEKFDGLTVTMIRQASDSGQLYGSVNSRDVVAAVGEAGYAIERNQVVMDKAIKLLGLHPIRVSLHPEVTVSVTANVAKSEEEAALQLQSGGAVGQADMEAEEDVAKAAQAAAEAALAMADDTTAVAEAADGLVDEKVERQLQSVLREQEDETPVGDDATQDASPDTSENGEVPGDEVKEEEGKEKGGKEEKS